jgi:hypothetical protein
MVDDGYVFMCLRDQMKIVGPGVPTLCVKPMHGLYPVELRPVSAPDPEQSTLDSPAEKAVESGSHSSSFGKALSRDCEGDGPLLHVEP